MLLKLEDPESWRRQVVENPVITPGAYLMLHRFVKPTANSS
jgi:hypothetical protein